MAPPSRTAPPTSVVLRPTLCHRSDPMRDTRSSVRSSHERRTSHEPARRRASTSAKGRDGTTAGCGTPTSTNAPIYSVTTDGDRTVEFGDLDDRPSGLGWMPDGTPARRGHDQAPGLAARTGAATANSSSTPTSARSPRGTATTWWSTRRATHTSGTSGSTSRPAVPTFAPADLALVRPDGSVEVAATGMAFPNGSVITADGSTLIVGESFGAGYVAFDIAADASLSNRRVWASVPGMAPDGCALDERRRHLVLRRVGLTGGAGARGRRRSTHRDPDADADLRVRARWRRPDDAVRGLCAPPPTRSTLPARRSARSSRWI